MNTQIESTHISNPRKLKLSLKLNIPTLKVLPISEAPNDSVASSSISPPITCPSSRGSQAPGSGEIAEDSTRARQPSDGTSSHSETTPETPKNSDFRSLSLFNEKYTRKGFIGGGTSAVVEKCIKKSNGQIYAVKKSNCEPEQILDMKLLFSRIRMLKHPNIVKYHSLYICPSYFKAFLVMQYFPYSPVSCHPLFSVTQGQENRRVPNIGMASTSPSSGQSITDCRYFEKQQKLQKIMQQILDAISYMHRHGICHRDIKPENILYDSSTEMVKIIDFGVSRDISGNQGKRNMMTCTGTTEYKAPELFRGGFYDELIDEWAAGITLYKLITGTTPFYSPFLSQTLHRIEACQLQFKQEVWTNYNPFVKELLQSLICPRENRITAEQAKNSLWFKNVKKQFYQSVGLLWKNRNKEPTVDATEGDWEGQRDAYNTFNFSNLKTSPFASTLNTKKEKTGSQQKDGPQGEMNQHKKMTKNAMLKILASERFDVSQEFSDYQDSEPEN